MSFISCYIDFSFLVFNRAFLAKKSAGKRSTLNKNARLEYPVNLFMIKLLKIRLNHRVSRFRYKLVHSFSIRSSCKTESLVLFILIGFDIILQKFLETATHK